MPLPTKGMSNALARRAKVTGQPAGKYGKSKESGDLEGDSLSGLGAKGSRPFGTGNKGLPNKPIQRASGETGGPKVVGSGLGPSGSQMEAGTTKIGKMPSSGSHNGRGSMPENGSGNRNNIPHSLTLGQGQNDNGRPAPAAMARRLGNRSGEDNHGGNPTSIPRSLVLGQGQNDRQRATPGPGNNHGTVSGRGFGGTARTPGSDNPRPGSIFPQIQSGAKKRLALYNSSGAGTMLKKGGKGRGSKNLFKGLGDKGGGDDSN